MDIIAPIEKVLLTNYAAAHKDECFALSRDERTKRATPITVLSIFSVLDAALKNGNKLDSSIARLKEIRIRNGIQSVDVDSLKRKTVTHLMKL